MLGLSLQVIFKSEKNLLCHDVYIFHEACNPRVSHTVAVFSRINENLAFLKCHQRLVCFGVKRINFSFRSVVKNRGARTVWTVHCASATNYQRKKSVITHEKKWHSRARDIYARYRDSLFGYTANCFLSFCILSSLCILIFYKLIFGYIFLNPCKKFTTKTLSTKKF